MNGEIMVFERQILSLALIEKELYQLYTNLSEKVEDVAVKTLFSYIATDSLKHSNILVTIIDEVNGSKAREQDCDENIIYTKELIKTLSNDVAKSEIISLEELYKKAFRLEYTGFAEYELDKDHEIDLNIFTLIVGDEERHQRILLAIITLCDKKLSFKRDAPIVKYQNPDSWYVPPRGRRS